MAKYKWITMGITLMAIAALSAMFAVTAFGSQHPIISKVRVNGPDPIGISLPEPTEYVFDIYFGKTIPGNGITPVRIIDTVPAEFEVVSAIPDHGTAGFFQTGKSGKSATRIEWDPKLGENNSDLTGATLRVVIKTRLSPGGGHKSIVHKPTSCGPLPINDGATAFEVDPATGELVQWWNTETGQFEPLVYTGPSNGLGVIAVAGAKSCVEGGL